MNIEEFEREIHLVIGYYKLLSIKKFNSIVENFGSITTFYNENKFFREKINKYLFQIKFIEKELKKRGIKYLLRNDQDYPKNLLNIYNSPILLFYIGDIGILKKKLISAVGSRFTSEYSCNVVNRIISPLVQNGIITVSGMAIGSDFLIHKSSLDLNCPTIAVLASSVDNPTPKFNERLYREILKKEGLVLSEIAPNIGNISKHSFVIRNRIITGLSEAIIIISSKLRSGSTLSANIAFDQQRLVYAIPGRIDDPLYEGNNQLISNNIAKCLTNYEEIFIDLNWSINTEKFTIKERKIIEFLLNNTNITTSSISKFFGIDSISIISSLELKGKIKIEGEKLIVINKE